MRNTTDPSWLLFALYVLCGDRSASEDAVKNYVNGMTEAELAELLDCSNAPLLSQYDSEAAFTVPAFEIETDAANVTDQLKSLGLEKIFDEEYQSRDTTKEVIADKPFLFVIKDDTADEVLFMGWVEDPTWDAPEWDPFAF